MLRVETATRTPPFLIDDSASQIKNKLWIVQQNSEFPVGVWNSFELLGLKFPENTRSAEALGDFAFSCVGVVVQSS